LREQKFSPFFPTWSLGHGHQQQKERTTMKEELEPVGINTYLIDRMTFDERKYVTIDFLNKLDDYFSFCKEFDKSKRTPMIRFDKPVDGWGVQRYKDAVNTVRYVFVSPNIIVRHFTMIEGDSLE